MSIVLRALKEPPFELLQTAGLRDVSLKTTLLVALALVKHVGDLQALSVRLPALSLDPMTVKLFFNQTAVTYPRCS